MGIKAYVSKMIKDKIINALKQISCEESTLIGSFCVEQIIPLDSLQLQITIDGTEHLNMPLKSLDVENLCKISHPSYFGWRDQTLLNTSVRDTAEIAGERLSICYGTEEFTILDQVKVGFGVPASAKLTAHLHNLLIYAPGQFFGPHQDSEKLEGMVASLVVILRNYRKGRHSKPPESQEFIEEEITLANWLDIEGMPLPYESGSVSTKNADMLATIDYIISKTLLYPPLSLIPLLKDMKQNSELRKHIVTTLRAEHALRSSDDWSISFKSSCLCEDCNDLNLFLQSSTEQKMIWPIAEVRRRHIIKRIQELELPISIETEKIGSPHKLLLSKTSALHDKANHIGEK